MMYGRAEIYRIIKIYISFLGGLGGVLGLFLFVVVGFFGVFFFGFVVDG